MIALFKVLILQLKFFYVNLYFMLYKSLYSIYELL